MKSRDEEVRFLQEVRSHNQEVKSCDQEVKSRDQEVRVHIIRR